MRHVIRWLIVFAVAWATLLGIKHAARAGPYVVFNDYGGLIGRYLDRYHAFEVQRRHVVILGDCFSACTMVLRMSPDLVCAGPKARFGFHAASKKKGGPPAVKATQEMYFEMYPPALTNLLLSRPITTVPYVVPATNWVKPCH